MKPDSYSRSTKIFFFRATQVALVLAFLGTSFGSHAVLEEEGEGVTYSTGMVRPVQPLQRHGRSLYEGFSVEAFLEYNPSIILRHVQVAKKRGELPDVSLDDVRPEGAQFETYRDLILQDRSQWLESLAKKAMTVEVPYCFVPGVPSNCNWRDLMLKDPRFVAEFSMLHSRPAAGTDEEWKWLLGLARYTQIELALDHHQETIIREAIVQSRVPEGNRDDVVRFARIYYPQDMDPDPKLSQELARFVSHLGTLKSVFGDLTLSEARRAVNIYENSMGSRALDKANSMRRSLIGHVTPDQMMQIERYLTEYYGFYQRMTRAALKAGDTYEEGEEPLPLEPSIDMSTGIRALIAQEGVWCSGDFRQFSEAHQLPLWAEFMLICELDSRGITLKSLPFEKLLTVVDEMMPPLKPGARLVMALQLVSLSSFSEDELSLFMGFWDGFIHGDALRGRSLARVKHTVGCLVGTVTTLGIDVLKPALLMQVQQLTNGLGTTLLVQRQEVLSSLLNKSLDRDSCKLVAAASEGVPEIPRVTVLEDIQNLRGSLKGVTEDQMQMAYSLWGRVNQPSLFHLLQVVKSVNRQWLSLALKETFKRYVKDLARGHEVTSLVTAIEVVGGMNSNRASSEIFGFANQLVGDTLWDRQSMQGLLARLGQARFVNMAHTEFVPTVKAFVPEGVEDQMASWIHAVDVVGQAKSLKEVTTPAFSEKVGCLRAVFPHKKKRSKLSRGEEADEATSLQSALEKMGMGESDDGCEQYVARHGIDAVSPGLLSRLKTIVGYAKRGKKLLMKRALLQVNPDWVTSDFVKVIESLSQVSDFPPVLHKFVSEFGKVHPTRKDDALRGVNNYLEGSVEGAVLEMPDLWEGLQAILNQSQKQ